ncbi:MAG: sporulation protein YqfD, partial [Bacillota bacterium]|nr:sporulation protein YqfD [Bacillota bacterium]
MGYLIVAVEGVFLEKFLNMASSRGITLWDIQPMGQGKMKIKVRIQGFKQLRHVARKQDCKMRIKGKKGMPFLLLRLEQRKMFFLGAVGFTVILYMLSSFVWFIDITGNENTKSQQILLVAEQAGLKLGVAKKELNPETVEKAIGNMPQIAWVGVKIKGTKVVIEVAEKVMPDVAADETIPAHLIATKDGLIQELITLAGVPAIKPGDTVRKGQILISGYIYPTENQLNDPAGLEGEQTYVGEPQKTRAKGIVRARVWYEETVRVQLEEKGYN